MGPGANSGNTHEKKEAVKLNCFLQIVLNIELEHYYSLSCFKEL